ncbi:aldehyde dehydrogenase family protein [Niallia oryzisoli]|uniref:Aldehyde dehydrogenase family protein n=1 Tax=Niallia oryzisoli TaxID=1737571 RepID=A0ABZ2C6Y7_9BACI
MQRFENLNKSFINGEWVEGKSQRNYEITDPYDNSIITTVRLANVDQVREAFEAAEKAQKEWAKTTPGQKREVLFNAKAFLESNRDEIVQLLIREAGGTVLKSSFELMLALSDLDEALKMVDKTYTPKDYPSVTPGKVNRVYKLPVGVITSIAPFNFPTHVGTRTIFPAIALGNSVVHKPDIQTGITGGSIIAKALEEAGLPKGVFNSILTDIEETGDAILTNPQSSLISFTGSTAVGRHIGKIAGGMLKKVALELGGNNPMLVLSDADVDHAVDIAVFGKFLHSGQICAITNRIIVHKNLYQDFITKFVDRVKGLTCGDPKNPNTIIGPVINSRQADKIMGFVDDAKKAGYKMVVEGERNGNVISPFVFADVPNNAPLACTELFGPIATIIPCESDEEAMRFANDTEYGLSSAIVTGDIEKGERLALDIEAGATHVNDATANEESNVPFGGVKQSGIGRFGYEWVIEEFTTSKWVSIQAEKREYPI